MTKSEIFLFQKQRFHFYSILSWWRKFRKATVPKPRYEIIAAVLSDVGCQREVNEDNCLYVSPVDVDARANKGILALVADGMGGHIAGETASKIAVDVISRAYYEGSSNSHAALKKAFHEANQQIFQAAAQDPSLQGMGTTCIALALKNESAMLAYVGDSRLYLVRNGEIYRMSEDHSLVGDMIRRGVITWEEARQHNDRNILLRALGTHATVEISTWENPFPVREGDHFVLCSDGLYDPVTDEEIKNEVLAAEPYAACQNLIALAKTRGGHDNITVGILSVVRIKEVSNISVPETRNLQLPISV